MSKISDLAKQGILYQPIQDEAPAAPEQEQDGNFTRNLKKTLPELGAAAGGTLALAGDLMGANGVRDYGLGIYEKNNAKVESLTRDSDSFSNALEGKTGMGDFLAGGAGYVAGQALTAIGAGGVGGFIGSQLAKRGIVEVVKRGATSAAAKAVAGKVAEKGAKMGAGAALFGQNLGMEAGSIYPDALEQAKVDGRELDGEDKARIVGSSLAAAGVDTAMDALMLGRVMAGGRKVLRDAGGKVMLDAAGKPMVEGMARAAAREVPMAMGREAVTEGIQTGIERFGAGKALSTADAVREYVDSMALGAVGGGLGGGAGVLHAQKVPESGPLSRAANAGIDEQILQLAHDPQPLVAFPDGSVGHKQDVAAYLSQFTDPEERLAKERELYGRDPATGKRIEPEPEPEPLSAHSPEAESQLLGAWAAKHDAVTLDYAQALIGAPGAKGQDLMIVPHPKGKGYTVVPSKWLTLDTQARSGALQKGDAARLPSPTMDAPGGAIRVDSEGGAAPETQGEQMRANAAKRAAAERADAEAKEREVLGTPTPRGVPAGSILTPKGAPFASQLAAKRKLAEHADTHEVAEVEGGFILRPKQEQEQDREPTKTEVQRDLIDMAAHEAATSPNNELPEPTDAQKEAGNYAKGHTRLHGLDITIENPAGSTRSGVDRSGKRWENRLAHHYGYIKRTVGADGDHVDAFIGPDLASGRVYIVNQTEPETGKFDEHKIVFGANSLDEARAIYAANYEKGWQGGKNIVETSAEGFKAWLKDGDTTKPYTGEQRDTDSRTSRDGIDAAETRHAMSMDQQDLQAVEEGLANDTDPANGKPLTPYRRRELETERDNLQGAIAEAREFLGEPAEGETKTEKAASKTGKTASKREKNASNEKKVPDLAPADQQAAPGAPDATAGSAPPVPEPKKKAKALQDRDAKAAKKQSATAEPKPAPADVAPAPTQEATEFHSVLSKNILNIIPQQQKFERTFGKSQWPGYLKKLIDSNDVLRGFSKTPGVAGNTAWVKPALAKAKEAQDLVRIAEKLEKMTAQDADTPQPAPTPADALAGQRLRAGTIPADEVKAAYQRMLDSEQAVKAELATKKKDALLMMGGPMFAYRHKQDTKPEIIESLYDAMLEEFAVNGTGSISYTLGGSGGGTYKQVKRAAIDKAVQALTQSDLDKHAEKVAAVRAERAEKVEQRAAGMADPKTLADYAAIVSAKKAEGMTSLQIRLSLPVEQRAAMDALMAEKSRAERATRKVAQQEQTMRAPGEALTAGETIQTKHTKHGHDLWQFQLDQRVSNEEFKDLVAKARRLGGDYSSYRGNGAVPGWQFKTEEGATAFRQLLAGDDSAAKDVLAARRDAFADDKAQSAVERLTEMADKLEGKADESDGRERKSNTARRARFAAAAEQAAASDRALATTMRNIAAGIEAGTTKFLDRVRQKVQIELMGTLLGNAKYAVERDRKDARERFEDRLNRRANVEDADHAEFPMYTAFRSDLASLGRRLLDQDGTKKLGQQILKVADDVTDTYLKFAKANLLKVGQFATKDGNRAVFASRAIAEEAIARSGYRGKAIVLPVKRGENVIVFSPAEAVARGIWEGDGDARITLDPEIGAELVEKLARINRHRNRIDVPHQFETAHQRRAVLARMGIETPAELRAALREFVGLKAAPKEADRVKQLERAMIGRRADGLDFFPTPEEQADEMVAVAGIEAGMRVLEPSAGMGHIADRIRAAGAEPDVVELSGDRRELLEAKGYNLVGDDFMALTEAPRGYTFGDLMEAPDGVRGIVRGLGGMGSDRVRLVDQEDPQRVLGYYNFSELEGIELLGTGSGYDRIVMNPPFSDRRDAAHVQHAYSLLKPGGRLVAIMGEGVFFGQDAKAQAFRDWIDSLGGTSEKLAEGTFMDPSLPVTTGVNARMVVIDKPAAKSAPVPQDEDDGEVLRASAAPMYTERRTRTIEVGGVRRPITNSAGRLVAQGVEEQRNFWDFFGDSKVVDESGAPLVVYHGTPYAEGFDGGAFSYDSKGINDFGDAETGFFFGDSAVANAFAETDPGAAVLPVYLSIKNPKYVEGANFVAMLDTLDHDGWASFKEKAIKAGHDGVIVRTDDEARESEYSHQFQSDNYIAFYPEQIKSATGNNGNFDPDEHSIVAMYGAPKESTLDRVIADMAGTIVNADEILAKIEADSSSADNRALAAALRAQKLKTVVRFGKENRAANYSVTIAADEKLMGTYSERTDTATLHSRAGAEQAALHELVHAATVRALAKGGLAAQQMRALWKQAQDTLRFTGEYGLSNVEEFVSEAHTNPQFRAKMARTPVPQSNLSFWQKFVGVVRRILGMPQQFESMLDRFMATSVQLMADNQTAPPTPQSGLRASVADHMGRLGASKDLSDKVSDLFASEKTFNGWWHKTVGTQYHKAQTDSDFKRVYDAAQNFLHSVSRYANDAADAAPTLLPKLDGFRDLLKKPANKTDTAAAARAIFTGTLDDQRVYSDQELRDQHKLTPAQITLYREFRAAVDKSLDDMGKTDLLRYVGPAFEHMRADVLAARDIDAAGELLAAEIEASMGEEDFVQAMRDKANNYAQLKREGYAPLMRFGEHTVYVTGKDGAQLFFGMAESGGEAAKLARDMQELYPDATVTKGVLSAEGSKLFAGISPDTIEVFANVTGLSENPLFQDYLKLVVNNRSALKRLIHRKGVAGYSEDASRVLASFVTSNARAAAKNLHGGAMIQAAEMIPKTKGDVKDEAVRLIDFLQNPKEEAGALRGLLFVNFIGGSLASAAINMTQPLTMTLPYLAQFGGAGKAAKMLAGAMKMAVGGTIEDKALAKALDRAEREGDVSPQEIHNLQAEAMRSSKGLSIGGKEIVPAFAARKAALVWGGFFGLAEQFNRRATFIAAYQIGRDLGDADPYAFAVKAIAETQGVYNRGNRPNWARGAVGATLMTFKQYSISYLEFLKRLPPKERALALGILVVAAGANGLPFAEDLDDVIDTIAQALGYNWQTKKARQQFATGVLGEGAADFVLHGVSGVAGMPLDVSMRMGMQNLLPATGIFLKQNTDKGRQYSEVLGAAGALLDRGVQASGKALSGDVGGAGMALAPTAIANLAKGLDMLQTGSYRDARGRKVIDTDATDAAVKMLGFQPSDVAQEQQKLGLVRNTIAIARSEESRIADAWARGVFEKDPEAAKTARAAIRDWNAKNPDSRIQIDMTQIARRLREMRLEKSDRLLKTAPKGMRGALRAELEE